MPTSASLLRGALARERASAERPRWGSTPPSAQGAVDIDGLEVRRADDLEVLHVGRVVEQVVYDARPLMHAVASFDQRLLARRT